MRLRGQKLDNSLFHNTIVMTLPPPETKGRSARKIDERNDFIVARYCYYSLYHNYLRYESKIEKLERVTHLEQFTLGKLISNLSTQIKQLMNQKPTVKWFKDKYPDYVWE